MKNAVAAILFLVSIFYKHLDPTYDCTKFSKLLSIRSFYSVKSFCISIDYIK